MLRVSDSFLGVCFGVEWIEESQLSDEELREAGPGGALSQTQRCQDGVKQAVEAVGGGIADVLQGEIHDQRTTRGQHESEFACCCSGEWWSKRVKAVKIVLYDHIILGRWQGSEDKGPGFVGYTRSVPNNHVGNGAISAHHHNGKPCKTRQTARKRSVLGRLRTLNVAWHFVPDNDPTAEFFHLFDEVSDCDWLVRDRNTATSKSTWGHEFNLLAEVAANSEQQTS